MMKKLLVVINFLLFSLLVLAQENKSYKITGTLKDPFGEPLPYASIALHNKNDKSLEKGTASNELGQFELLAKSGSYYLKITFLSYEDKTIEKVEVQDADLDLGFLKMKTGSQALEEVTVAAEKIDMELKLDKRVINVSKDINNRGRNAVEILDNIPSVAVDVEGTVSLRGSENVRILVDGKPSGLVGLSSSDALRQLQAGMIERIELITNPSARYDAEGEVGIINIVLKKEQKKNINGTLDVHTGYPHNHGIDLNLNYRREFANIFGSYGLSYQERPGSGKSFQSFNYEDTSFSYNRLREHSRNSLSNSFRMGSEFYLNGNNSFTLSGLYRLTDGSNISLHRYTDYNSLDELARIVERNGEENETKDFKEFAFNYNKKFKKKDQVWTFDAKWMDSEDLENNQVIETSSVDSVPALNQRISNTENEINLLFQTDYVHPFGKDGKLEAGLKANLRDLDNDYKVEQLSEEEVWQVLPLFNNHLLYTENIYAAYLMGGNKLGAFSYQGGLRVEYSSIEIEMVKTQEKNPKDYLQFFPSVHLSYKLDDKNDLQLSYSRRISRPRFWWLIPFVGLDDARNIYSGNPDLNPEYTNSFEVGYLKNLEKGSLLPSIYYRFTTGVIDRILISDSSGLTRSFPINLGFENSFGLELSGSYRIMEAWNLTGNFNFFRAISEGIYEEQDFSNDTYSWNFRASSKWTIKKKLGVQTSFNYRSPRNDAQGKIYSQYFMDLGASYDFFKGNATLTLSGKDLFNTRKRRYLMTGPGFVTDGEFQWRSRQLLLTFSYRLNQKKMRGDRKGRDDAGGDD